VVSFTPRPLYSQGKNPWYLLKRRLGEPQSRSGDGGEEKYSQPLPGLETPIFQPIAQRGFPTKNFVCITSLHSSYISSQSRFLNFTTKINIEVHFFVIP
jgi:hypothetical protein